MRFAFRTILPGLMLLTGVAHAAEEGEARWWPVQTAPSAVIRVVLPAATAACADNMPLHMLTESLAGLAAKAVNEGRGDEMVWLAWNNPDYEDWYAHTLARLNLEVRGILSPWELAERFARQRIVKGYILYRRDTSEGETAQHRHGMDLSINVATSLAGLLDGVVVEECLESEAMARGLALLFDARGKTQQWVFDAYRDRFSRHMVCTQDPRCPHTRDFAIAQRAIAVYGFEEPVPSILAWLEPLSPVLGWNGGDEYKATLMTSLEGHIQSATNWCLNLPLLMAASDQSAVPRPRHVDPARIDWSDRRPAVSFVITDGDNVQWYLGGFARAQGDSWYGNPGRGRFPFGWSCCFSQLVQLCPEMLAYCVGTQSRNDAFIEWGGGYFYPDKFALNRSNAEELLARHARRTWAHMRKTGTRIIAFNFSDFSAPEARRACETYAREMDGLLGILAFQYYPYEGGAGTVLWVQDARGWDVPVVSARYAIWEHSNQRPRAGTPAKIAREIGESAAQAAREGRQQLDWVITHAWSFFRHAPGPDEDAENMDQTDAAKYGGVRGYEPVGWCVDRLPTGIRVALPEELIWRIRMQHNPSQTQAAIARWGTREESCGVTE